MLVKDLRPCRPTSCYRRLIALALVLVLAAGSGGCAKPAPPPATAVPEATTPATSTAARPSTTPAPTQTATATIAPPTPTPVPIDAFFSPARLNYAPGFYVPQIETFLAERSPLLSETSFRIGDQRHSFAETLVAVSSLFNLNPQILLALLESQSGLLSSRGPSPDQLAFAMGYRGDGGGRRGLYSQLRWAARELRFALRDYAGRAETGLPALRFADGTRLSPSPDISLSRYLLARVIAPTTTPANLDARMAHFRETFTRLFGDPRPAPTNWPAPAQPFLSYPLDKPRRVTSFFDHDTPFLRENGSLVSFWGLREAVLSYDGHTGWDYGAYPPDAVLAAADGTVVFAGNSDDGCATPARAVIVDHANGYRTLSWHLAQLEVATGDTVVRGDRLGIAGSTGCSTGPHLHFQVQYLGRDVDPYGWCSTDADPWATNAAGQLSVWLWADAPDPCGKPPPGFIIVDDSSPGFLTEGEWSSFAPGYAGGAHFAATQGGAVDRPWRIRAVIRPALAIWQPTLPAAGRYKVLAYLPYLLNGLDDSRALRYLVRHNDGETVVEIDGENFANSWADLGSYNFDPQQQPRVLLSTLAGDAGRGVWADAIAWVAIK